MSQEMINQRIKKTCDVCGASKEYDLIGVTFETAKDLAEWYTVVREVFDGERFHKMMVQAYGLECLAASGVKLQLPVDSEDPGIDLSALQMNGPIQ